MPTYEYVCEDCGIRIEVVQKMSEPGLKTCGACGGALRKVFYPAGILFKGSGFYSTDNRSKPKTAASTGSNSEAGSGSGSKPGSGSETTEKSSPTGDKEGKGTAAKSPPKKPAKETA